MFRPLSLLLLVSSLSLSAPVFALPGELVAVEQRCGLPVQESQETSEVTGQLQRTLFYPNDMLLHFQPMDEGWSFTTGWHGHFPISRETLEERMPCFRMALLEVAEKDAAIRAADPELALEERALPFYNRSTFGIQHFWVILGLGLILGVGVVAIPNWRRRELARRDALRKKELAAIQFHRRPLLRRLPFLRRRRHIVPDLYDAGITSRRNVAARHPHTLPVTSQSPQPKRLPTRIRSVRKFTF